MIVTPLDGDTAKEKLEQTNLPSAFADLKVFQILLKHPKVADQLGGTLMTLLSDNALDARLREFIIMRIGWVTGSVYEWTQHYRVSKQIGMDDEEITAVRDWRSSDVLGEAEKAVLQATDDVLESGRISDATWDKCAAVLPSDQERIELVIAIGNWVMFSQLLRSLEVPLEDGVTEWPPDGLQPQP